MRSTLQLIMASGMLLTLAFAQEQGQTVILRQGISAAGGVGGGIGGSVGPQTFEYMATQSFSFDGAVVKNAPYSAEAVTESTQRLADGNRIARKTNSTLYRDSEGRTRREETLGAIGPWASSGEPAQSVFINDPVSKTNLVLDTKNKTVRKMPSPKFVSEALNGVRQNLNESEQKLNELKQVYTVEHPEVKKAEANMVEIKRQIRSTTGDLSAAEAEAKMKAEMMMMHLQPGMTVSSGSEKNAQKESLGTQMIEGVQAEGMRTTFTIPAGSIGNDLPIQVVSERWYSPELQTVVMTKHSDPRMGDTVYRLTNISRREPASSLFQAPADYTPAQENKFFMRTKD
jgi:hypothetical protein